MDPHIHAGESGTAELEQDEDLRSSESDYEGLRGGMGTDLPGRLQHDEELGTGPPI